MDIIAAIDAVTGCQYPPCGRQLDDSSPSPDFCSPQHQAAWSAARTVPLDRDDEPVELAAHVFNAAEFHHPETCVECTEGRWCPDRSAGSDVTVLRPGAGRSVVAALRRAMAHGGHHVEVSTSLGPEQSPAEHRVLTEWEQQFVDGVPDYEWAPYDDRRPDRIYVADVGTPYAADADGGWREIGTMTSEVVFTSTTPDSRSPIQDLYAFFDRINSDGLTLTDWQQRHLTALYELRPVVPVEVTFEVAYVNQDLMRRYYNLCEPDEPLEPAGPIDPRERALWLRQHRNTGPPPSRRRAPRQLPPRRSR